MLAEAGLHGVAGKLQRQSVEARHTDATPTFYYLAPVIMLHIVCDQSASASEALQSGSEQHKQAASSAQATPSNNDNDNAEVSNASLTTGVLLCGSLSLDLKRVIRIEVFAAFGST